MKGRNSNSMEGKSRSLFFFLKHKVSIPSKLVSAFLMSPFPPPDNTKKTVAEVKPNITAKLSSALFQTVAAALQLLHHRGGQRGVQEEEESQQGLEGNLQEINQNIFDF